MRIIVRFVFAYGRIMIFIDFPRVQFIDYPPRPEFFLRNNCTLFCKKTTVKWTCKCRHHNWEDHYNDFIMDALIQEELHELVKLTF